MSGARSSQVYRPTQATVPSSSARSSRAPPTVQNNVGRIAVEQSLANAIPILQAEIVTAIEWTGEECKGALLIRWHALFQRLLNVLILGDSVVANNSGYELGLDIAIFMRVGGSCPNGFNFSTSRNTLSALAVNEKNTLCAGQAPLSSLCGVWEGLADGLGNTSREKRKKNMGLAVAIGIGVGVPVLTLLVTSFL